MLGHAVQPPWLASDEVAEDVERVDLGRLGVLLPEALGQLVAEVAIVGVLDVEE